MFFFRGVEHSISTSGCNINKMLFLHVPLYECDGVLTIPDAGICVGQMNAYS